MEELLIEKLEAAKNLKDFTKELMTISTKTNYEKIDLMLDERQRLIEKINKIDLQIKELYKNNKETSEAKTIKKELKETFKEIYELDNIIRKNINYELKNVKRNLNQPDISSKSINIKA